MKIIQHNTIAETIKIIERPAQKNKEEKISTVKSILQNVKTNGDAALIKYTAEYDGVQLANLAVLPHQITAAAALIPIPLQTAIDIAYQNIYKFHEPQLTTTNSITTMKGISCYRKNVAIQKVGLYIPGGTAPLFSTLLMLGIPAQIAGCSSVVLCTPPNNNYVLHPAIAYTAQLCGITQIYLCGGAQAVAAMAYGTATIPQVHKIFGPGNQYVTIAKQLIQANGVAIDMPAGPSEVLVIADAYAKATYVAADLLAQAEHGADSQVICITNTTEKATEINNEILKQLAALSRKENAAKALENSYIIVVDTITTAMELSNNYAPEHLIIQTNNAIAIANDVVNAGSVFVGAYTPESVGDYASGTNHVLPTSAYANAYSGVSVDSFVKKITFQHLTEIGLQNIANTVVTMATAEGLDAHANAVLQRLNN